MSLSDHTPCRGPAFRVLRPLLALAWLAAVAAVQARGQGPEPPALNPFGPKSERPDQRRDDARPGVVETSDGRLHPGLVYLTRDARLKIFDETQKRHREIPLKAVQRIDCTVQKEWMEQEWRFKENANDEKYFTGRSYPAREYTHRIRLQNGQEIRGELSGIVYLQPGTKSEPGAQSKPGTEPEPERRPQRYLLHKRDKGAPGTDLKSLVYVRAVVLGEKAVNDARSKTPPASKKPRTSRTGS